MTKKSERCPLCGKPAEAIHKPFCSQGCKDRDLINWLGDAYRVPDERVSSDGLDSGGGPSL